MEGKNGAQVEGGSGAQVEGGNGALEDVVLKTERVFKNLREPVTARTDEGGRSGLSMVISSWQGARATRSLVGAQGSRIVGEYASTRGRRVPVVLNIWIIYACAPVHLFTSTRPTSECAVELLHGRYVRDSCISTTFSPTSLNTLPHTCSAAHTWRPSLSTHLPSLAMNARLHR